MPYTSSNRYAERIGMAQQPCFPKTCIGALNTCFNLLCLGFPPGGPLRASRPGEREQLLSGSNCYPWRSAGAASGKTFLSFERSPPLKYLIHPARVARNRGRKTKQTMRL